MNKEEREGMEQMQLSINHTPICIYEIPWPNKEAYKEVRSIVDIAGRLAEEKGQQRNRNPILLEEDIYRKG